MLQVVSCFEHLEKPLLHQTAALQDMLKNKTQLEENLSVNSGVLGRLGRAADSMGQNKAVWSTPSCYMNNK